MTGPYGLFIWRRHMGRSYGAVDVGRGCCAIARLCFRRPCLEINDAMRPRARTNDASGPFHLRLLIRRSLVRVQLGAHHRTSQLERVARFGRFWGRSDLLISSQ